MNSKQPRKKIAIVANSTWNIYNFRQNVIELFIEKGYEIFVLAPIDEYIEYKERFPDITHINLRTLHRDSTNPVKDLLLIEELRRKYQRIKPDLIIHYTHKPNIFGTIAAKLCKIKSVSVITGLGYSFINRGFINQVAERLYKTTSRYNEMVIFENEDDMDLFISKDLVDKDKAVAVKGCGVDINYYASNPSREVDNKVVTFTFIGRLLKDKGIEEFALAASSFKKNGIAARFIVLGDFDEENPSTIDRDALLKWINNETVDYKGFVKDVRPFIEMSSCIVLPSYREGMPRIILEAMSMGKAVITTNTAGCRETVVEGKNGFLVEIKNPQALIEAMQKFIALGEEQRKMMGVYGRTLAENTFSDEIIAQRLFDIISRL